MRTFLYHVYPAVDNDVWRWTLKLFKQHLHFFDRVIVGIAQDGGTVPAREVSLCLREHPNIELVIADNDRFRGEIVTMIPMLEMAESLGQDDLIFYAHAKGVSHTGPKAESIRNWVRCMYLFNFRMDYVSGLLIDHDCVGAFQRGGLADVRRLRSQHGWHYSGNFWWIKSRVLFSADWPRYLRGKRHAAENLLGQVVPVEKAACSGGLGRFPLYHLPSWSPPHGRIFKALASFGCGA